LTKGLVFDRMPPNMKRIIKISIFSILSLLFLTLALPISAQYYGGVSPTEKIIVDKKIKNPQSKGGEYVDNLGINDYHFSPSDDVYFKITVKNTGSTTISKVELKDIFPSYVDYVLGSGAVSKEIRDISTSFENLQADESRDFYVRGRVVTAKELPNDRTLVCVVNKVQGWTDGQNAEDTAQLCIEKGITQPPSGTNILLLSLGFGGISLAGLFLKKLAL